MHHEEARESLNTRCLSDFKIKTTSDSARRSQTQEEAESIKDEIAKFLKEKIGLTLSPNKTSITHISKSKGFNFLGFNIRKYRDGKLIIKPQKEKVVEFLRSIREILANNKTAKTESIIQLLNPMLQGFAMYYRFVVSKELFAKVDHQLWEILWRWAKRRHPNKPIRWVSRKYFTKVKGDKNVFTDGNGTEVKLRKTILCSMLQEQPRQIIGIIGFAENREKGCLSSSFLCCLVETESRVKGNFHARFGGGWIPVRESGYPTRS